MIKTLFLFILFLALGLNANAQRYSTNKLSNDYHQYIPEYDDPYNPAISGVCSFLIPGLGQMYSGEYGRGFAFLGGYTCCTIIAGVGMAQFFNSSMNSFNSDSGYPTRSNAGVGTFLVGIGGMAVVSIWSIVDAVKVAKVNDMYLRNFRRTSSVKLELSPYVEQLSINNQITTPVGMTMKVNF